MSIIWTVGSATYASFMLFSTLGTATSICVSSGVLVAGATCNIPPDHDDGCDSPEPDLSIPHHLPEMDTDSPR